MCLVIAPPLSEGDWVVTLTTNPGGWEESNSRDVLILAQRQVTLAGNRKLQSPFMGMKLSTKVVRSRELRWLAISASRKRQLVVSRLETQWGYLEVSTETTLGIHSKPVRKGEITALSSVGSWKHPTLLGFLEPEHVEMYDGVDATSSRVLLPLEPRPLLELIAEQTEGLSNNQVAALGGWLADTYRWIVEWNPKLKEADDVS